VIECFAGLFTFFLILGQNGWLLQDLLGIQAQWDNVNVNDLKDSYGQEWVRINERIVVNCLNENAKLIDPSRSLEFLSTETIRTHRLDRIFLCCGCVSMGQRSYF
jgi:hypothetical protein